MSATSFLRREAVIARTGISLTSMYRLIERGEFPRPIRIAGSRVAVWVSDDIDAWMADQLAKARNPLA